MGCEAPAKGSGKVAKIPRRAAKFSLPSKAEIRVYVRAPSRARGRWRCATARSGQVEMSFDDDDGDDDNDRKKDKKRGGHRGGESNPEFGGGDFGGGIVAV